MFKTAIILMTALYLFFCLCPFLTKAQSNKHALIVAIGNYPEDSGWWNLSSVNDVELLQKTLLHQGFPSSQIATLINEAATKEAILKAIQQQLIAKVQVGDIAHFHFSGHGQQAWDKYPKDELVDSLDEALVPYNSPLYYDKKKYQGQYLIRDDELREAFESLQKKLGAKGHLLVTIDACHSGTVTRGKGVARGTDVIMASPAYLKQLKNKKKDLSFGIQKKETTSTELAPMVALFSSSAEQNSYEYYPQEDNNTKQNAKKYGLFSYAFCKALPKLSADANYDGLLDQIKFLMTNRERQTPQGEGKMEQKVLGIGSQKQLPYFVAEVKAGTITIPAGHLQGITEDTRVFIHRSGTIIPSEETLLTKGTIDWVEVFSSDVQLDNSINPHQLKGAWVFIEKLHYPKRLIKVEQVPESLKDKYPFIKEVETGGELYFGASTSSSTFSLYEWNGTPLCENCIAEALCKALLSYERASYLRQLEISVKKLEAKLEILISNKKGQFVALKNQPVKVGTTIKFKISNIGEKDFYFAIFDIQPNHLITNLSDYLNKNDCFLKANTSYESEAFTIEEPLGWEVLKIVTTSQPLYRNLNFLPKCDTRQQEKDPIKQLLEPVLSRGGMAESLMSIRSVKMEIVME